ncbi:hypothetical protein C8Q77DRAFT_1102159 [Trametes polyzona]|nr:hypothetical protein C8Q77DRAFT_1102159 [Trametes polyzona]
MEHTASRTLRSWRLRLFRQHKSCGGSCELANDLCSCHCYYNDSMQMEEHEENMCMSWLTTDEHPCRCLREASFCFLRLLRSVCDSVLTTNDTLYCGDECQQLTNRFPPHSSDGVWYNISFIDQCSHPVNLPSLASQWSSSPWSRTSRTLSSPQTWP